MKEFWLCLVPLFVAVDAIGVLPMFISLTQGIDSSVVRRIVFQSVVTAVVVALTFVIVGPVVSHNCSTKLTQKETAGREGTVEP